VKIGWIRGQQYISFNRPHTWFTLGVRGSGKSSLIEHVGELYREKGHHILDLFGSRDGEGLAWLRHPDIDPENVLLLHGDSVEVTAPVDTRPVKDFNLGDLEKYKVVISSSPLYCSPDDEFTQASKITGMLYRRLSWGHLIYTIVREAANLYYSRLKVTSNQTQAKADMVYLIREARHMGIALGLDTLKYTSIDSDIRNVADYLVFKGQGVTGLPHDLNWVYGYIDPHAMRVMKPNQFVILARSGALGLGVFPELKWHKREREHIMDQVGIKCEYGEPIEYGESKGTFKTLGDFEHAELITLYCTNFGGMAKIAEKLEISSGTVYNHVKAHNRDVKRNGKCERCSRVGSEYAEQIARR